MDRKKLFLLLGALVVAIGTALAARSMFAGAATPQAQAVAVVAEPEGPKVLVSKRAQQQKQLLPVHDAHAFSEFQAVSLRPVRP